jgi:hypothetical protein
MVALSIFRRRSETSRNGGGRCGRHFSGRWRRGIPDLEVRLSRVPHGWLRLAVVVLLATFGTLGAAEGAGVRWPGGDLSLLGRLATMAASAFAYLALLRFHEGNRLARP